MHEISEKKKLIAGKAPACGNKNGIRPHGTRVSHKYESLSTDKRVTFDRNSQQKYILGPKQMIVCSCASKRECKNIREVAAKKYEIPNNVPACGNK